jgi:predicted metalloprotease with PDZ domain
MSQMAAFTDAARSVDRTNTANTFISYYTYGAALALGLDLSLRGRSNGKISLDDYMRAMWRVHGKPGGPQPGLVAKPYTLKDARDRLAEVSGDRAFADSFFDKYIEGQEAIDYGPLLLRAGYVWRKSNPGAPWLGTVALDGGGSGTISNLIEWGSPLHAAGLNQGDTLVELDGRRVTSGTTLQAVLKAHKPGDRVPVSFRRRNGVPGTATIVLAENPAMEAVAVESAGGTLTSDQKQFRAAWLRSKRSNR